MTLLRKPNSFISLFVSELKYTTYLKINLVLAGVITLILVYSGIFSPDRNNYPIICIHERLTGIPCVSCGLSHSFSLILRGRIAEAYQWNSYGMTLFLFFVSQLFMRVSFSVFYLKYKENARQLINYDIAGSVIIFVITFFPFFRQLIISIMN